MTLLGRKLFAVATDLVIFAFDGDALRLLLIKRAKNPFAGRWALPGGFLEGEESLDEGAARELAEETGVELRRLDQLAAFYAPDRDPRGDVLSIAYLALVRASENSIKAGSDAAEAKWHDVKKLPKLAFDHEKIVAAAGDRLAEALYSTTTAFELLPDYFTLAEAQRAFECIIGEPLDKRNFRTWAKANAPLKFTGKLQRGQHRPAKLYRLGGRTEKD